MDRDHFSAACQIAITESKKAYATHSQFYYGIPLVIVLQCVLSEAYSVDAPRQIPNVRKSIQE